MLLIQENYSDENHSGKALTKTLAIKYEQTNFNGL